MKYLLLVLLLSPFFTNAQTESGFIGRIFTGNFNEEHVRVEEVDTDTVIKKNKKSDTIKVIMLCIDTTLKKRTYTQYHTLDGTQIEHEHFPEFSEEIYYDERCFWKYGYRVNDKYFTIKKELMQKNVLVIISFDLL